MTYEYKPPADEQEALRRFFLEVYHDAEITVSWHTARAAGGQHVGVAPMPLSIGRNIMQAAANNRLSRYWQGAKDHVMFGTPAGNAPTLGGPTTPQSVRIAERIEGETK